MAEEAAKVAGVSRVLVCDSATHAQDITENVDADPEILRGLDEIAQKLNGGSKFTGLIFSLIAQNNIVEAGKNMSRMDGAFHAALVKISDLKSRIRYLQKSQKVGLRRSLERQASNLISTSRPVSK